jgi:hypothetical protein
MRGSPQRTCWSDETHPPNGTSSERPALRWHRLLPRTYRCPAPMALVYGGAIMLRARGLIRQRNVRGQISTLTEGDWGYANFREFLFFFHALRLIRAKRRAGAARETPTLLSQSPKSAHKQRSPKRSPYVGTLLCESAHRAHTYRYEGPEVASTGSTSAPHEGQWNVPSGRRRISGWPHSQACSPEAPGSAIICSRVSSIAVPSTHPHEPQRAPSPPKGCSSPAWQTGQTR